MPFHCTWRHCSVALQTNGNLENGRGSKLFHRSRTFARDRFFTKTTFSKPTNRKEALGITRKRCTSLRLNLLKREWRRSKKSRNYNRAVRASPASSLAQSNYCVIWCLNTGAKRPVAVGSADLIFDFRFGSITPQNSGIYKEKTRLVSNFYVLDYI